MKPRVIRSDVGDGLTTLVPFGISVDVSQATRRLSAGYARLAREFRAEDRTEATEPPAAAKGSRRR